MPLNVIVMSSIILNLQALISSYSPLSALSLALADIICVARSATAQVGGTGGYKGEVFCGRKILSKYCLL